MTLLQAALAKVDELIAALTNGKLIGTAVPAAAAAPAAPAAVAAAAPTSGPSAGSAAVASTAKKPKPAKAAAKPAVDEGDAFDKAQLAVGRVTLVSDHPSGSEKLWLLRVDIGGGVERQVVAGLKQHASREELTGRLVALVLNLKPAKLAGELSEAMVLAADHTPEGGATLVRVLVVPEGCEPGQAVVLQGSQPAAEFPKECKSKKWAEVVAGLAVQGGVACYKGVPLATSCGVLTAEVPDGAGIH